MDGITLPRALLEALDETATALRCSPEEILERALERYLRDFSDLRATPARLRSRRPG